MGDSNMKANKITLAVQIDVLSIDSIGGLLIEVAEHISCENRSGKLSKDDGDCVQWDIISQPVEF
jgi:hypothetical protein